MVRLIRLVLLFIVFISTGGIYFQFYSTFLNIFSVFLAGLLLLFTKIPLKEFTLKVLIAILTVLIIFVVHFILNLHNSVQISDYLSLFIRILVVIVLLYHYRVSGANVIEDFNKILILLLVHGVLNFCIINIFKNQLFNWERTEIEFTTRTIGYVFFTSDYYSLLRNCGLFWEPGVYQLFINLYLFINLFVLREAKWYTIAFIFLLILSTQSTLGIIIFGIIVFYYLYFKLNFNRLLALIFFLLLSFFLFLPNIKAKFSGENKISYQARIFDSVSGILAVGYSPVIGYGYNPRDNASLTFAEKHYKKALETAKLSYIHKRGNTNSVVINFVYWGIPVGFIILYLLYKQTLIKSRKNLFFLFCILTCSVEPLLFSGIFLLIIFSALVGNIDPAPKIVSINEVR